MTADAESKSSSEAKPTTGPTLNADDQARVDAFLARGVNAVPRKPFRPIFLMLLLIAVVTGLSALSVALARYAGIY